MIKRGWVLYLFLIFLNTYLCQNDEHIHEDISEYKCIHEEFAKSVPIQFLEKRNIIYDKKAEDWQPLVIHARFLEDDPAHCTSVGQTVTLRDGTTVKCTQGHVLTPQKINYIKEEMIKKTVERFNKILSIDRQYRTDNIKLSPSYTQVNVQTPSDLVDDGVDADFVLLYTARPINNEGTLAIATTLAADASHGDRPVVGYANFDPSKLKMDDINSRAKEFGIAIHEVTHALGFSSSFFTRKNLIQDYGSNFKMINGPKVVEFLREHFDCDSLNGGILENEGGDGTATSHWKKSIFMNEYMTGTASTNPVVTELTMAYFEDANWYRSNDSFTDPFGWGHKSGCQLPQNADCQSIPISSRCNEGDMSKRCLADRSGYGGCGKGDIGMEQCSIYFAQTACIFPYDEDSDESISRVDEISGESFDYTSRCFSSTLNRISSISDLFPVPSIKSPKCYPTHCSNSTTLRVKVDGYYYRCDYEGGSLPITGFGGSIECTPRLADIICQNAIEDDSWPLITSVEPSKAKPEQTITIKGKGFRPNSTTEVLADFPCTDVVVVDENTITAKLPDSNSYGNPKYLNGFGNTISIIVRDDKNRSDALVSAFQIDVPFGLTYFSALFNWMKNNPLLATILVAIIVIPCFCICYCIYKKCSKKNKKPKRGQYEEEYSRNDDEYYYDTEYVDTQRHPPPRALQY